MWCGVVYVLEGDVVCIGVFEYDTEESISSVKKIIEYRVVGVL